MSRIINLNPTDEKGWTPAILLVMNLKHIQKEKEDKAPIDSTWQAEEQKQNQKTFKLIQLLLSVKQDSFQKVNLNIESHLNQHILHLTVL